MMYPSRQGRIEYSPVVTDAEPQSIPLSTRLAQGGVLAAAIDVFGRKGYAATRVEDILEAAGIARRTFYRHFKSKDDVLAALYQLATGEISRAIRAREDDEDPFVGLGRGIDVYLDYHAQNAKTLLVVLAQSMQPESRLAPMRRAFRAEIVKLLDAVAVRQGKKLSRLVFVALLSALEGLSLELLETGAKGGDIAVAKTTLRAILALALGVPGPPLPRA
jgi:AcrR family transcriptional regulator